MLKDSQFVQPVLDKKVLDERIFGQKSGYCFFGKRAAFFVGIFQFKAVLRIFIHYCFP